MSSWDARRGCGSPMKEVGAAEAIVNNVALKEAVAASARHSLLTLLLPANQITPRTGTYISTSTLIQELGQGRQKKILEIHETSI